MLLGHKVEVWTDHINLTSKNLGLKDSDRVLRWTRLLLEEFDVTIDYIKGDNNTVADAISRLEYSPLINPHAEDVDAFDSRELNWHQIWNDSTMLFVDALNDNVEDDGGEAASLRRSRRRMKSSLPVTIREIVDAQLQDKEYETPPKDSHIEPVLLNGEEILCFVREKGKPRMVIPRKLDCVVSSLSPAPWKG